MKIIPIPRRLAILLFLPALALSSPLSAAVDVPGAGGVKVDGELIPMESIWDEYRFQTSLRNFIHSKPAGVVDEKILRSVVSQVVNREILEREGIRLGYALTDGEREGAHRRQFEGWRGESNFGTAARMMGVSREFMLRRAESSLLREKMAAGEARASENLGDGPLRAYYDDNRGRYLQKEPPAMRYIFVPRDGKTKLFDLYREIATEADGLRRRFETFASLPPRYSRHQSAAAGGIVPEAAGGKGLPLQPPVLMECRFTPYLQDGGGLHVYLRDCQQPLPFEEVRVRVRGDLVKERETVYLQELLARLRGKAKIEYLPLEGDPPLGGGGASH